MAHQDSPAAMQPTVEDEKHHETYNDVPANEPATTGRGAAQEHTQINGAIAAGLARDVDDFMTLVTEADEANSRERGMKLVTAFKTYPKAMAWSVVLSSALIMEGYDTAITGSYNAYPSWLKKFGVKAPDGSLNSTLPYSDESVAKHT
jgi:SP family general alpha glucoside:H+ symporter-like MFS transporter